ncbi:hypothetical protein [Streptomyces murinus]|uniref:hypothetical protein n=1 Tax=Streptomyces murinus TaxID=33900 RepID=UPI003809F01D
MSRLCWADVVERAAVIVTGYDAVGGCTLRQVYYRLVAEAVIPHTAPAYRRLSARLARARRREAGELGAQGVLLARPVHGRVLPGAVVRQYQAGASSGNAAASGQADGTWTSRSGSIRSGNPWLAESGIPVLVVRGFGSQSYVQVVKERPARDPRPAVLLYVGDFDASGANIERDWVARTACWASAERVLLTHDQVREHELPSAAGEAGDPRWPAFARRYGLDPARPVQWEVEALDPAELRRLVAAAVALHIDHAVLAARLGEEARQRARLRAVLDDAGRRLAGEDPASGAGT